MPKHEETLGVQENFELRHFENPVNTKKSAFVSDTLDEYLKENQHIRNQFDSRHRKISSSRKEHKIDAGNIPRTLTRTWNTMRL